MKVRFARPRLPTDLDTLTPLEQTQVVACGKAYDGEELPAAARLPTGEDDEETRLFGLELWDVEDDAGDVVYSLWIYQVDSGSIFKAGTTIEVAAFVQNYLECADDELAAALRAAQAAHTDWPEKCGLRHMSFGSGG